MVHNKLFRNTEQIVPCNMRSWVRVGLSQDFALIVRLQKQNQTMPLVGGDLKGVGGNQIMY